MKEQLDDIGGATAFVLEQQKASSASNVHLYKTCRTMTDSFVGSRNERILPFFPTAQRWGHRLTLRMNTANGEAAQTSYLAKFLEDIEITRQSAREIVRIILSAAFSASAIRQLAALLIVEKLE